MKALIMVMTSSWMNLENGFYRAPSLQNPSNRTVIYTIMEDVEDMDKQPTPQVQLDPFPTLTSTMCPKGIFWNHLRWN